MSANIQSRHVVRQDLLETEQFEADFFLNGEIECEELDDTDADVETGLLAARVRAAGYFGA
jgi:hypothetical protein